MLSNRIAIAFAVACAASVPFGIGAGSRDAGISSDINLSGPAASGDRPKPDLSGRKRAGKASFYASRFAGRKMADGTPMSPNANNAASRTLPLGTVAKVTNLETGKSAVVTIQDRGPYVDGRIVDLSPATAQKIGLTPRQGVVSVVVEPITVPLPDGRLLAGIAARDSGAPVAGAWTN